MTWRNWAWHGGFKWVLIAMSLVFIAVLIPINLTDDAGTWERWITNTIVLASLVLLLILHNWITIRPGEVRFGYTPFYRRTLPLREIREVRTVTINPMREFGGWGLKGHPQSKNGMLLGGHPNRGLRSETFDNRRYVLTFPDLDPIINELARYGCTLSAGNGEDSSGKV